MLDVAGVTVSDGPTDDALSRTDTWHGAALPVGLTAGVSELAATLHDVEERLRRKNEHVDQLERELDDAAAELREAREAASRSGAEIGQLTSQFAEQLTQINTQHGEQIARLNARFAGQIEQLEADLLKQGSAATADRKTLADLETQLAEARTQLAQRESTLQERERSLTDARREAQAQEARLRETEQARETAAGKVGYLDEKLTQRTADLETHRNRLHEALQRVERAEVARVALVRDLEEQTTRGERQLEVLRAAQTHRAVFESMLAERDDEIHAREQRIAQLVTQVSFLAERDERIRSLEDGSARAAESLTTQQQQLEALQREIAERTTRVTELDTALQAAGRHSDTQAESLRLAQERHSALEGQIAAARDKESSLATELAGLRRELEERSNAVADGASQAERLRTELETTARRHAEVEQKLVDQQDVIRTLQADVQRDSERGQQTEQDLRAAEELLNRLEADVRQKDARIDELTRSAEALQGKLSAAQRSLGERDEQLRRLEAESQANAVLLGNIQQSIKRLGREDAAANTGAEQALEGLARLFVRNEGGSEIVHVLSRKTKIGRTPDNDIQIDTNFISRHHAAVLASPRQTIVEDLNSTNGVFVNGRKVSRQTLNDGDVVTIGKTSFRFALKPLGTGSSGVNPQLPPKPE